MEINVGQVFKRMIDKDKLVFIEIKQIDVTMRKVEFMVSGDGVSNPDQPRAMRISTLAKWLEAMPMPGQEKLL